MSKFNNIPDFGSIGERLKKDAVIIAKKEGVDFFEDSFDKEGFTNTAFEKWQDRASPVDYKILQVTSALKNSIQVFSASSKEIVFGSDVEYAELHNEGGVINVRVTEKSRRFFWFMFMQSGEQRWKWMALTKKDSMRITIPKRQFIGESATLMSSLDTKILKRITTLFKQL